MAGWQGDYRERCESTVKGRPEVPPGVNRVVKMDASSICWLLYEMGAGNCAKLLFSCLVL